MAAAFQNLSLGELTKAAMVEAGITPALFTLAHGTDAETAYQSLAVIANMAEVPENQVKHSVLLVLMHNGKKKKKKGNSVDLEQMHSLCSLQ